MDNASHCCNGVCEGRRCNGRVDARCCATCCGAGASALELYRLKPAHPTMSASSPHSLSISMHEGEMVRCGTGCSIERRQESCSTTCFGHWPRPSATVVGRQGRSGTSRAICPRLRLRPPPHMKGQSEWSCTVRSMSLAQVAPKVKYLAWPQYETRECMDLHSEINDSVLARPLGHKRCQMFEAWAEAPLRGSRMYYGFTK